MEKKLKKLGITVIALMVFCALFLPSLYAQDAIKVAIIDSGALAYVDGSISFTDYPANIDPLDHGTQIAKLIRKDNPSAKLFMLQVCSKQQGKFVPSREAVFAAIKWAVDNRVDIVNMSLVMRFDEVLEKAITNAAVKHGIIFVAASGNHTMASHFASDASGYVYKAKKDIKPAFPSSCPFVISVGAIDRHGKVAPYSSKDSDVYADGHHQQQEGTSFSCARITAKVVQILSSYPDAQKSAILQLLS
ncbi:MAG: S8 family serine peptidase [Candidatus Omnitrophota bacterium]